MKDNEERGDIIERLLDEALSSYCSAEPQPGLVERVLSRVRTEGGGRKEWQLWWVAAVAVAACLVLAVALSLGTRHGSTGAPEMRERRIVQAPPRVVPSAPVEAGAAVVARRAGRVKRVATARLPQRPQFPSRSSMTEEERALAAFAARSPKEAAQMASSLERSSTGPLHFEPIHIEPLDTGVKSDL